MCARMYRAQCHVPRTHVRTQQLRKDSAPCHTYTKHCVRTIGGRPAQLTVVALNSTESAAHARPHRFVPHGMVWYDTVNKCHMVWYGVVWYGMVWHGMVWHGQVCYCMTWTGVVWHGMVRCGVVASTVAHPWYGMVSYAMDVEC